MNRFCQKQKDKSSPSRRHLENLVICCAIPKVASEEWRKALSVDLGPEAVEGKNAHNRTLWQHLNEYSTQNVTDKLQNFYKISTGVYCAGKPLESVSGVYCFYELTMEKGFLWKWESILYFVIKFLIFQQVQRIKR